jgi:hypothetical protein
MEYSIRLAALLSCMSLTSAGAKGQTVFAELAKGCYGDFVMFLAQEPPEDGGIARYSMDLVGIEQAEAFVTVVLRSGEPVAGFTIGGEDLDGDGTLFAAQDLEARGGILWGLGTRGNMPVAAGTFAIGADPFSVVRNISVDVFTRRGSRQTTSAAIEFAISTPHCIAADYNGNGAVEQADLDLVLLNWGHPGMPQPDGWLGQPLDDVIDQSELDNVLLNWGNFAGRLAAAPSVPEPGAGAIVCVCLGVMWYICCCVHHFRRCHAEPFGD